MMLGKSIASGRTAEIFEYGDGRVLKLFRAGWSRRAVEHEARVAEIVAAGGFAPKMFGIVEADGRAGIVYERVDGVSMSFFRRAVPW